MCLLVVTKLSRLTKAEFSPRKLWGVFFVAPVAGLKVVVCKASPNKFSSNGSWLIPFVPFVVVFGELLFRFVITSNSSKSVEELWLVGDHGSALVAKGGNGGETEGKGAAHGSAFGEVWSGCQGSAEAGVTFPVGGELRTGAGCQEDGY